MEWWQICCGVTGVILLLLMLWSLMPNEDPQERIEKLKRKQNTKELIRLLGLIFSEDDKYKTTDVEWNMKMEARWRCLRRGAAQALGELGDTRAVDPLIAALYDEDEHVRSSVAVALGQLKDVRAVDPLIAATENDKNKYVRGAAWEALWQICSSSMETLIVAFKVALKYEAWLVLKTAGKKLEHLGWQPVEDELSAACWIARNSDWDRYIQLGVAVKPLIAALKDDDRTVRRTAAAALVNLYASGNLGSDERQLILNHRSIITRKDSHDDRHNDWEAGLGCGGSNFHSDHITLDGIDVDFPL